MDTRDTDPSIPAPTVPVAAWRRGLGIALGVVAAALPMVVAMVGDGLTPQHSNVGGVGGWLLHVIGMVVLGLLVGLVALLLWKAATLVLPSPSLWLVLMFCVIYSPVAGWKTFDALNVRLDRSPAEAHTVRFVRFTQPRKGPSEVRVTSWRGDGTEDLDRYVREDDRKPGRPMRLVTHQGALGREYVTELTPL